MSAVKLETSQGNIIIELEDDKVPITVKNFLDYVNDGVYENTLFHRVIKDFMIQTGGYEPTMQKKATRSPIVNEAKKGIKNIKGSIAMARTNIPNSATSQFFINLANNAFLDYKNDSAEGIGYCAFGRVTEGMDIVNLIGGVKTTSKAGHDDVPVEDVVILKAKVI
jgi:peptidyl-prolyl cis-trans isomerase B (cyclophilin B)